MAERDEGMSGRLEQIVTCATCACKMANPGRVWFKVLRRCAHIVYLSDAPLVILSYPCRAGDMRPARNS
jgi:hypothetical protein